HVTAMQEKCLTKTYQLAKPVRRPGHPLSCLTGKRTDLIKRNMSPMAAVLALRGGTQHACRAGVQSWCVVGSLSRLLPSMSPLRVSGNADGVRLPLLYVKVVVPLDCPLVPDAVFLLP